MSTCSRPFKPAFGGKPIVPGCSDKTLRSMYLAEQQQRPESAVKLTTASRASAALEQYWQQHGSDSNSSSTTNSNSSTAGNANSPSTTAGQQQQGRHAPLPGGERELAHKTRDACWRDSIHLAHQPGSYIPDCQGTPKDIEEKEKGRTRGIPGYTGCQPPPGASRPPELPPPAEVSRWTAINAFDERRPRIKGIPGYTGHQPHNRSGSPKAGSGNGQAYASTYTTTMQGGTTSAKQHHSFQRAPPPGVFTTAPTNSHSSSARPGDSHTATGLAQQQQQQQQRGTSAAAAAAYPSVYVSTTGSRISSPPLYFCDGVQVPAGQVPVPHSAPQSAAAAAAAAAGAQAYYSSTAGSSGGHDSRAQDGGLYSSGSDRGSSGGVYGVGASGQQAEVMVVEDRAATATPQLAAAPAAQGAAGTPPGQFSSGMVMSGSSGGGVHGIARVGRPAVGPWCTTYSTTFVQQEAYTSLMQQFKEAALQRQRGK